MFSKIFNKRNKRTLICALYILLIALTLAFIFRNSAISQESSGAQSDKVVEVIRPIVDPDLSVKDWKMSLIIRKLGHIIEFALLGAEIALFAFHLSSSFKLRDAIYATFGGLLVANVDELIQIFTERGSAVSDVFIDLGGLVFGLAVGYGIAYCMRAIHRSARTKREERSHPAAKA